MTKRGDRALASRLTPTLVAGGGPVAVVKVDNGPLQVIAISALVALLGIVVWLDQASRRRRVLRARSTSESRNGRSRAGGSGSVPLASCCASPSPSACCWARSTGGNVVRITDRRARARRGEPLCRRGPVPSVRRLRVHGQRRCVARRLAAGALVSPRERWTSSARARTSSRPSTWTSPARGGSIGVRCGSADRTLDRSARR